MEQQNMYGKLFSGNGNNTSRSVFVGMDDDAYRSFLRRKENRKRSIKDLVKEINELGSQTSYFINANGLLQLVHMANSYQLCFYSGDTAVTYVINSELPYEAFMEKVAFWQTIMIDSGITLMLLTQPLFQGQFRQVIWAMEGNLADELDKLPFENL